MNTSGTPAERERLTRRGRLAEALMTSCQAPRLHLALIVSLTGAIGFYVAYLMLRSALDAPWLRYPLAVAIAYLAFLMMLSSWVRRRSGDESTMASEDNIVDASGADIAMLADDAIGKPPLVFDDSIDRTILLHDTDAHCAEAAASVVVAATALLGGIWAAASLVLQHQFLLIELLIALLLSWALYRRVRNVEERHWLGAGLQLTLWRSVTVTVLLALLGVALHVHAPEARSFGELLRPVALLP